LSEYTRPPLSLSLLSLPYLSLLFFFNSVLSLYVISKDLLLYLSQASAPQPAQANESVWKGRECEREQEERRVSERDIEREREREKKRAREEREAG
jgi:hypothetical protein